MNQTVRMPAIRPSVPEEDTRPPVGWVRRTLRDSGYNLTAFLVATPAFVLVVTGLSLGLGTLVIGVGLLALTLTAYVARGFAHLERLRLRALMGRPAPTPTYLSAAPGAGRLSRVLTPLRDPQSWLDVLWALVSSVTGTTAFVVVVAWWTTALSGVTYWLWQQWLPDQDRTLVEVLGLGSGRRDESLLQLGLGLVALLTLPSVVRACATAHAATADVLLNLRRR